MDNSGLAEQVLAFLFSLMDLASTYNNLFFVYALASSADMFGEETTDIREAIQASSRQKREIYKRLFSSVNKEAPETQQKNIGMPVKQAA